MLQKLGDHVAACYERAADCAEKAKATSNEGIKTDFLKMADTWMHLAHSYEFVQSLQAFLLDSYRRRIKGDYPEGLG